jgi:TP901-1 family phage major tail protein
VGVTGRLRLLLSRTYWRLARHASAGGFGSRAVDAAVIPAAAEKTPQLLPQMRVNDDLIASHAPCAATCCAARMTSSSKSSFKKIFPEGTPMTAQKGKDLLIKIADGASYTTVAGLRTRRLAFNAETVDITHSESANRWRELLDGAGVKRAAVSGRGLFKDAATDALMRQTFFDGNITGYQIVIPSFGTVQGPFQITSLEFAGEHNGELTYDMALESAGELIFAANA